MSTHFTWQSAVLNSDCESTTKYVLLVVGTYMNQHGSGAFPSYNTIAETASLGRSTVIKHIDIASARGWIRKIVRPKGNQDNETNLYEISFPQPSPSGGLGVVHQEYHLVHHVDYPSPSGGLPLVHVVDPNTPSLTPQGTPQGTQPGLAASDLQNDGLAEDLSVELLAHRKRKKSPLTQRAWGAIKREAGKAGWDLNSAVAKLIERDWKSFEAEWVAPKRGGANGKQAEWDAVMAEFVGQRGNPDDPYTIDMEYQS